MNERVLWGQIGNRHLKELILSSELGEKLTRGTTDTQKLTRCFFTHTHIRTLPFSFLYPVLVTFCCCGQWQIRKEMKEDRTFFLPSISQVLRKGPLSWSKASKKLSILFLYVLEPLKRKLIFFSYRYFDQVTNDLFSLHSHLFGCCRWKIFTVIRGYFDPRNITSQQLLVYNAQAVFSYLTSVFCAWENVRRSGKS
jgi:hypothetical protein